MMRFFEFNDYGYSALIGAETAEKAEECYKSDVADIEEGDGPPDEISLEEARVKYGGDDFDRLVSTEDCFLFLIDGGLI